MLNLSFVLRFRKFTNVYLVSQLVLLLYPINFKQSKPIPSKSFCGCGAVLLRGILIQSGPKKLQPFDQVSEIWEPT